MVKKELEKRRREERRTPHYRRRMLESLLRKAGHDIKAEKLKRRIFRLTFGTMVALTIVTLTMAAFNGKEALPLIPFYLGLWTAVFASFYIFVWMLTYLYLDIKIYRRTKELEEVLPDFLQLASSNISAGMPIDRALWFAIRPNFGVLAKEVEDVAKATLAGEDLEKSLVDFTERYDSLLLKRSINILLEGMASGGEMADLLNKIALDIQETRILKKEMSANVATYAIFITFASIVMAPVLFGLATELLGIIVNITSSLDLSSSSSMMNIKASPEMLTNFRYFCLMMLTVSGGMSAAIVSVIRRGNVKDGLRDIPIYILVSIIIYFVATWFLHLMFAGMI